MYIFIKFQQPYQWNALAKPIPLVHLFVGLTRKLVQTRHDPKMCVGIPKTGIISISEILMIHEQV